MSKIEELADRVERLLLRHDELRRTNTLLVEQLASVTQERDNLRSRLNAARHRIDVLLERLPQEPAPRAAEADGAAPHVDGPAHPAFAAEAGATPLDGNALRSVR